MKITTKEIIQRINGLFDETNNGEMSVYVDVERGAADKSYFVEIKTLANEERWEVQAEKEEDISTLVRELSAIGFDKEKLHWGFTLESLRANRVSYSC